MEAVFGIEVNDDGEKGETMYEKRSSTLSSPNQLPDPVVYKLVRVEGDGRFVPATDDEIMEVEDFLEDDKSETCVIVETGQFVGCVDKENSSNVKSLTESPKGLLQFECPKIDQEKLNAQIEDIAPFASESLNESNLTQHGGLESSKHENRPLESGSSGSTLCIGSKLDSSLLNGEICLDNLSIKELHDLFKASFGRETTVKDKLWLKRRIAMGLTNSIDVPTTSFVIKDGKFVEKREGESRHNVDDKPAADHTIQALVFEGSDSPRNYIHGCEEEDHQTISAKQLRNCSVDMDSRNKDQIEQGGVKRIRKPTRRYIEELSEVELRDISARSMNLIQNSGVVKSSPELFVNPIKNISSDGRTVATRLDSLGGSIFHVPCVLRIRRSRPRKNVGALMKFSSCGLEISTKLVEEALVEHESQLNNDSDVKPLLARSPSEEIQFSFIAEPEKEEQLSVMDIVESGKESGSKQTASSGSSSDDNVLTVPTAKGGMRRKHHRAWSLVEVMKLVEGVSKCGPGRWSEIKRLAFASYSYRTSVDLKDKWRNLLKASFAHAPPDEGINSRKNASVPIPAPILLRVRELAEMNAQVPLNSSSSKLVKIVERSSQQSDEYL